MKKTLDIKKLILLNMPYILMGLFATNFGEAWRMAQGADASEKFLSLIAVLPGALESFWPSLHPLDLLVGLCCGGSLRLAVYLKSKNAKKYRHGLEYGSARWGTREDIAPYVDPVFQNNVILTKTESLTMNSRPKDPKTARNKNVLVIGGSGSGKTRFWLKPNLMQMHSSYVVTDPKGTILVECGKMLQRGAPKPGKDGKPMKDSDIVQIDSRADVIIFSSSVVTAKMDLMQRFFGFEQYIRAGAQKTIEIIRDLDIVDSLEKFVAFENKSKLTNAKKLLKAKNSPVLQMKKNDLLENLKKHSRYKTMFKFEEDHIVISSQKEAAAFIKMLNDDIVRSELTGKEYDSSSKMLLGPVGASH